MGLLDGTTQQTYYQGIDHGNYQFVSLEDIINQFMVVYVGDQKIINKTSRMDVAFHAQRALAELSFDTFKSVKTQEITLPPSLQMILPQDYVNYTKVLYSDSAGIKHPIYPTKHTQNPLVVEQHDDGRYRFREELDGVVNGDFDSDLTNGWNTSEAKSSGAWSGMGLNFAETKYNADMIKDTIGVVNSSLEFGQLWQTGFGVNNSHAYGAWQHIDVSSELLLNLTATGTSSDQLLHSNATTVL